LNCFQELINLSRYFFQDPAKTDFNLQPQPSEELKEVRKILASLEN
jgi:hypothetical protein